MKRLEIISTASFSLDNQSLLLPTPLISKLYHFLSQSYHLANQSEFEYLIIQSEKQGELTVFYGPNDEVAGFTRTWKQSMTHNKKQITAYITYVYLNPLYKVMPTANNVGLTSAIRYKLDHPQEELVSITFANTPTAYEFISQLSDTLYPKASQRVPDQIISVVNDLKKQNGWISTHQNPMNVCAPLVPLRSHTSYFHHESSELYEFYMTANPDFMQGNCLLVYMPLHLANINYKLISHSNHSKNNAHHHSQNSPSNQKPH